MKNNDLIKKDTSLYRVIDILDGKALVIDCNKKSVPKWIELNSISDYVVCPEELGMITDINELNLECRKIAHQRFSIISNILPFVADKGRRSKLINQIAEEKGISRQTICNYLWLYLVYQNISALAPKINEVETTLSQDEKNIRCALNKYFYTKNKNSLTTAYTLMLKEFYCDSNGNLISEYPSFYQFRYFYRKNNSMQKYLISRNGIKQYQRDNRPLLGDGIQEFANCIGFGMLDSTVCDIYLVNEVGAIIGRPILTACVDAYSGLCCGYSLTWEGGVYSLRNLMLNVITDKVEWCNRFGIEIDKSDWNCDKLPSTLITDMGKEYVSSTFEQIAELGITVINLPPYRPELKGMVEKFFDIVQNLYKPHLKGKGVIECDFQERGAEDYRKNACLTMNEFEKIILYCIIHYNTKILKENFPYNENMLYENIKPFSNCIWNYNLNLKEGSDNLIPITYQHLILTLLPRTQGIFSRKGLTVNNLHYKHKDYVEQFLKGGTVIVAYNPDDITEIWLIDNGNYVPFTLIENRFSGKRLVEVEEIKSQQKTLINESKSEILQAKVDLANHIEVISSTTIKNNKGIKGIRANRQKEQQKTHIDFVKEGVI